MINLNICTKIAALVLVILAVSFTSCRKEPMLAPGTTQVCFDQKVMPVIQSNCAMSGCHSANGESPDLSSYMSIKSTVISGDPNKSKLYNVITSKGLTLISMPPKPRPKLYVEQVNLITIWILQGADHTTCP